MVFTELLGRLHPLLVHFPIGILLFAIGLMAVGRWKKMEVEVAVSLAWGLGAVSAVLACGAGWFLAQSGEYDTDVVAKHQWMGLATAALATVTYWLKNYRWPLAFITVGVLSLAGHFGGILTHGENYLFPDSLSLAEKGQVKQAPLPVNAINVLPDSAVTSQKPAVHRTFMYRDEVVPILKASCYSCHSARKKKGGLRLDSEVFIKQGGKHGSILAPGNPQRSKLYTYLILPQDDKRHMPPKGKLQLTPRHIAIIYHWIQKGASFQGEVETIQPPVTNPIASATDEQPVFPAISSQDSSSTRTELPKRQSVGLETALLAKAVTAADPSIVDALKKQHVSLVRLSEGSNYLSVNFVNVKPFDPQLLTELRKLGPQVMQLRLSGQPIRDADLTILTSFKSLTRLNLDHTRLSDTGLHVLQALPNLEQLNLYGTQVTDRGLDALAQCPSLKVVYLWQTQTTPEGIQRLQKARPDLKIETGSWQLNRPDTVGSTDRVLPRAQ